MKRILMLMAFMIASIGGINAHANENYSLNGSFNQFSPNHYQALDRTSETLMPHLKSNFSYEHRIGHFDVNVTMIKKVVIHGKHKLTLIPNQVIKIKSNNRKTWEVAVNHHRYKISKRELSSEDFTMVNTRYLIGNSNEVISELAPNDRSAVVPDLFNLQNHTEWLQISHNKLINGFVYSSQSNDWEKLTLINKNI
ncbi:hypothetical protein WR164_03790 [Philodulcilactobacillus myokoensis]|uniref:Uncharacterized protein n=1 Tax=Philodulcilactobacillus myokoensis TaxID=2929573 RepID=A0A9W6ES22_9LACO|nr:hypothetical protein [Philodulcilactobacillus myokoensis]GLB46400.1 hypothetical protein WR164_03790 [Philodulcilactobacillus myokoensis]